MKIVGFLGCCKTKLLYPAPAENFYKGALFQYGLLYLKTVAKATDIYIFSAMYGILKLDDIVEPYSMVLHTGWDKKSTDMTKEQIAEWYARTVPKVQKLVQGADKIIYLCNVYYRANMPPGEVPILGMGHGRQLKFLKNQVSLSKNSGFNL